MIIGSHLSTSKGFFKMAQNAVNMNANTFAFFIRNPRGFSAKVIDKDDAKRMNDLLKEYNFGKLVVHAPYALNLCSNDKKILEVFKDDLQRMENFPGNYYNLHPGTHGGKGEMTGIINVICNLNDALTSDLNTIVLIETMAGKGTEVGKTFKEIKNMISGVKLKDKIGVCLDTCHAWDAGYDMRNIDTVLEEFNKVIGIDYLKAVHLNDSKNEMGSHKDRHAQLGEGKIGLEALTKIVNHKHLKKLPFILETPDVSMHAGEIALMRQREV